MVGSIKGMITFAKTYRVQPEVYWALRTHFKGSFL
jgi:hypothetical protein